MGLPLFVTPVEPDVASKAAEKVASAPRSSIRRQRTIRGPHARLNAETRRRRMLGMVTDTNTGDYEVWENQRSRTPPIDPDFASVASLQTRAQRMIEEERGSRDTLSFERQRPPNTEQDGSLMPPVPESRDYSGIEDRQMEIQRLRQVRQDLRSMARRHPAPTPPYTETDIASINRPRNDSPRLSSFTPPAMSPARQPPTGETSASTSPRRPLDEDNTYRGPSFHDAGRSILSERVQALNRASNNMERSRRLMRQARLDGLGDRDRSLSPEGGGTTWDTLLTSITPDPQPPSAGSSFASASASASAAAASSSSSSGPASASTSMTSLGRTEDSPTIRDCDISDSGTNTEDEEGDIAVLEEVNRTGGDPFWRIYAEVVRERAVARHSRTGDIEHLGGMHRIISRLAEREDIPDEWWAGAGLSRNFRREPTS